jgi:hypothetical protein
MVVVSFHSPFRGLPDIRLFNSVYRNPTNLVNNSNRFFLSLPGIFQDATPIALPQRLIFLLQPHLFQSGNRFCRRVASLTWEANA